MTSPARPRLVDVVTPPALREKYADELLWTESTLSDSLRRNAVERPGRVAVIDAGGARLTSFAQLDSHVDAVVRLLESLGIGTGDVVSVQLPNCLEAVVAGLAVLRTNAVLQPMIPAYRDRELEYMLGVLGSRLLITPGTYRGFDHESMGARLCERLPGLARRVLAPGSLRPGGSGPAERWDGPVREFGAVSMVMFSSGTESAPKAIMHTEQTTGAAMRAAIAAMEIGDDDVVWTPTPIGHSTGFNYGARIAIEAGVPLVLQDRWDSGQAIGLIREFNCSFTAGVPTVLRDLIERCRADGTTLPSMSRFFTGGAPVEPALVDQGHEVGIGVYRLYGSTESLAATCTRPQWPRELRARSDGVALPGVEVQVRPSSDAGGGLAGEVLLRSPSASVGFAHDPDRTSKVFDSDGWLRTGDLGVLNAAGQLTIVGRAKEILIRGGMNIAPREIEDLLLQHHDVIAVAVVGLPDARLGERCCAVVVPAAGSTLSLPDVVSYLRQAGLASYKLPEQLFLVKELPTNASGKVLKQELVQLIVPSQ